MMNGLKRIIFRVGRTYENFDEASAYYGHECVSAEN